MLLELCGAPPWQPAQVAARLRALWTSVAGRDSTATVPHAAISSAARLGPRAEAKWSTTEADGAKRGGERAQYSGAQERTNSAAAGDGATMRAGRSLVGSPLEAEKRWTVSADEYFMRE